jgi:polygalacturonase
VTIVNPPDSPNTDGINPDSCRNVRISDCHVDVGDDCITIKSGKEDDGRRELRPCENITVTNCTLIHGHGGVVIGSEISGNIRNIAISNCVFVGTDRGIRIKARRGRGGVVEDIRVSNLVMDGVLCPIVVNLFYGCGAWGEKKVTDIGPQPVNEGTPRFRRLRYSNITARRVKYAAAYILGLPERFVEDIAINDCSFYLDPENTQSGQPAMASVCEKHCRAGLVAQNVRALAIRNVDVRDQVGEAVVVKNGDDVADRVNSPVAEARGFCHLSINETITPCFRNGAKAIRARLAESCQVHGRDWGRAPFEAIRGAVTDDDVVYAESPRLFHTDEEQWRYRPSTSTSSQFVWEF